MTQDQINKITQKLLQILPPQDGQEVRVHDYYLKVLDWIVEQLNKAGAAGTAGLGRPFVVGINGPQGSGKSTLAAALVQVLPELGLRGVTLSIDDFYLTRQEQLALASQHSSNPLLQQRGYPGTHDIQLGVNKLLELRGVGKGKKSASIRIPSYDKSKHQGQGDRRPESEWTEIYSPLDVVFLDGWMLGFTPVSDSVILENAEIQANPVLGKGFREVNQLLSQYQSWYDQLDAFVHIIPNEIKFVIDWRVEAEERMKAQGKAGMSREEITAYVKKFILAYQIYLPQLVKSAFLPGRTIAVVLSKARLPISISS